MARFQSRQLMAQNEPPPQGALFRKTSLVLPPDHQVIKALAHQGVDRLRHVLSSADSPNEPVW